MLCHVAPGLFPHIFHILLTREMPGVYPDCGLLLPIILSLTFSPKFLPIYQPVNFLLTNENNTYS